MSIAYAEQNAKNGTVTVINFNNLAYNLIKEISVVSNDKNSTAVVEKIIL